MRRPAVSDALRVGDREDPFLIPSATLAVPALGLALLAAGLVGVHRLPPRRGSTDPSRPGAARA